MNQSTGEAPSATGRRIISWVAGFLLNLWLRIQQEIIEFPMGDAEFEYDRGTVSIIPDAARILTTPVFFFFGK